MQKTFSPGFTAVAVTAAVRAVVVRGVIRGRQAVAFTALAVAVVTAGPLVVAALLCLPPGNGKPVPSMTLGAAMRGIVGSKSVTSVPPGSQ